MKKYLTLEDLETATEVIAEKMAEIQENNNQIFKEEIETIKTLTSNMKEIEMILKRIESQFDMHLMNHR